LRNTAARSHQPGPGGIAHEYWRHTIKKILEGHEYTVTTEYEVSDQRYVDLCARRKERTVLVEIETGKSDVTANIAKCDGHGELVVFFTTKAAHEQHRNQLPPNTNAITPETINQLQNILQ
jgi:hypothetical protein